MGISGNRHLILCRPKNGDELVKCQKSHLKTDTVAIVLSSECKYEVDQNITFKTTPFSVIIEGNGATIYCNEGAGFLLHHIEEVNISNVIISGCGRAAKNSQNKQFRAAVFINDSVTIILNDVTIQHSSGVGLALLNSHRTTNIRMGISNSNFIDNALLEQHPEFPGGGGLYIEQTADIVSITITNCSFINNNASTSSNFSVEQFPLYHNGENFFGRGGGLNVNLKGVSQVQISLDECVFENNTAHRGGGVFVHFLARSQNNRIRVTRSNFTNNQCTTQRIPESVYSAGGALGALYHTNTRGNKYTVSDCTFENNTAYFGGAISMGTQKDERNTSSIFLISECTFTNNVALIGSAVDFFCFSSIAALVDCRCLATPTIEDSMFLGNGDLYSFLNSQKGRTFTTVHLQGLAVCFKGRVEITGNHASGVGLEEAAVMEIHNGSYVLISNNSGQIGGGIVSLGGSTITLYSDVSLTLIDNMATERGGGMYVEQPNRSFTVYSYTCFIQYYRHNEHPRMWQVNVTFRGNMANGHINNIFASSIYPCVWPNMGGNLSKDISMTFCGWKSFYFHENCTSSIRTLPQTFTKEEYAVALYPNRRTEIPHFRALDDYNSTVTNTTIFTACLMSDTQAKEGILEPDLSNEGLQINRAPGNYTMVIQTASHMRSISTRVNITIFKCPLGYKYDSNKTKCVCAVSGMNPLLQCTPDLKLSVFIGHCVAYNNKSNDTVVSKCPFTANHLESTVSTDKGYAPDEFNDKFCKNFSRKGYLCQECTANLSIDIYSSRFTCMECNHSYINWIKAIGVVIGPQTVFFVFVVVFHIGITSPSMNGYIFFSHVITLPLETLVLSSAWSLDNAKHTANLFTNLLLNPYRIWTFDYPEIFKVRACLHGSLKIMHAISFRYIHALYPVLLVAVTLLLIELHARNCKPLVFMWRPLCFLCVRLRRNWEIKTSVIDAFATVILLSYSKIVNTSLYLLARNVVQYSNHSNTEVRLDYDTSVVYLEGQHIIFAAVAIVMLLTFGFIPPLLLILYPTRLFVKFLAKLKMDQWRGLHVFVETFQGAYKNRVNGSPERRWFSGLYFIFRIIVFVIFAFTNDLLKIHLNLVVTYTVFLLLLVTLRPYKNNFYTFLDASFLGILVVVNCSVIYCVTQVMATTKLPTYTWRLTYALLWIPTCYLVMYLSYLMCTRSRSTFIQHCISRLRRLTNSTVMYFANTAEEREGLLSQVDSSSNSYYTYDQPTHSSLENFGDAPDRVNNPQRYYNMESTSIGASYSIVTVDKEKDKEEHRRSLKEE